MQITEVNIHAAFVEQVKERVEAARAALQSQERLAQEMKIAVPRRVSIESAGIFDSTDGYVEKRRDFENLSDLVASLVAGYTAIHGSQDPASASVSIKIVLRIDQHLFELEETEIDSILASVLKQPEAA